MKVASASTMSDGPASDAAQSEFKQIDLKISLPKFISEEVLVIQYSNQASLTDLRQTFTSLPITRNLTNYNVFVKGTNISELFDELTPFADILAALNLSEDDVQFDIKEKPYTLAGVYDQVQRLRNVIGLHFIDKIAQDFGATAGVNKFNTIDLTDLKVNQESETTESSESKEIGKQDETKDGKVQEGETKDPEASKKFEITEDDKIHLKKISENLLNLGVSKLSNQVNFADTNSNLKIPIKSLAISQWSPVPASQRVKGDLLYLTLQTVENDTYHITCHFSGFFVNKCSTINFNPDIKLNEKGKVSKNYLLYDLIRSLSSSFEKIIEQNEYNLTSSTKYPETYLLPTNSFLAYPWLVNSKQIHFQPDVSRSQLPLISNGVDGSDFIKEWNDDIQGIKDLPNSTIEERILKEKLIAKTIHDFNVVATETAINIIKGNLSPMNPNEDSDRHIYLKNGIFYSSGSTAVDAFETTGGNEAARYTCSKDLSAIKILNQRNVQDVHNLLTSVIDFMGKRIVCQAPVPGIFNTSVEDEVEDKVVYGLASDNSKILINEEFKEPLETVADVFHLKPHTVETIDNIKSDTEIVVSKDTKGLYGTDGRKYVIDLYRTTPLDVDFIQEHFDLEKDKSYPHGEASIRHEAVESWWRREISALVKAEKDKAEKEGKADEEFKSQIKASDVSINPDSFTGINESKEDQDEVRKLSKYVKNTLIEEFLDTIPSQIAPFDGKQLSETLHNYGINLRYLGYIAQQVLARQEKLESKIAEAIKVNTAESEKRAEERAAKEKENAAKKAEGEEEGKENEKKEEEKDEVKEETKATYEPIIANHVATYKIVVQEMIARSVKHLLRKLSADVPLYLFPAFVAHFHNCLLGSEINSSPQVEIDQELKQFYSTSAYEFTKLDSPTVLDLVQNEVFIRFRFNLPDNWTKEIKPAQLLREIALKFGIQWKAHEYTFTLEYFQQSKSNEVVKQSLNNKSKKKNKKDVNTPSAQVVDRDSIFVADDIISFVPKVKDSGYKSSLIDEIFGTARAHIADDNRDVGIAILNDLVNIQEQIYGLVNPETAKFFTSVSQVYGELGFEVEAANLARKAIILCERTLGFDSAETINSYMNGGFYESVNLNIVNSMRLFEQAVATLCSVYGSDHPAFITTLSNLADNLSRAKLYDSAVQLFEKALELSKEINGSVSEVTGIIIYRLANVLINSNKIEQSLQLFSKASEIFSKVIGEDDSLTKEANKGAVGISSYLEYLKFEEHRKKHEIAASTNNKGRVKSAQEIAQSSKLNKKQIKNSNTNKKVTQSDPTISSKSIDEIMNFIEGGKPKKSKKTSKK